MLTYDQHIVASRLDLLQDLGGNGPPTNRDLDVLTAGSGHHAPDPRLQYDATSERKRARCITRHAWFHAHDSEGCAEHPGEGASRTEDLHAPLGSVQRHEHTAEPCALGGNQQRRHPAPPGYRVSGIAQQEPGSLGMLFAA